MNALLDPATLLPLIAALAVAGVLIGVLAGLLGIGGGEISVPVFYEFSLALGHAPEVAMPMAVGYERQRPSVSWAFWWCFG